MMKKVSCLLLCLLLLSGCGRQSQGEDSLTEPSSVPQQLQSLTETAYVPETTLPAEITMPVESVPNMCVQENGALITVYDSVPAYDANVDLSFPIVSSVTGSGILDSAYYHIDSYGHLEKGTGLFRICIDPPEMNQGSHYGVFLMTDGGLKELPRFVFSKLFEVQGESIGIEFEYSRYDGEIIITYISEKVEDFRILDTSLGNNKCLVSVRLHVKDVLQMDYPMILDVETGTLIDFLEEISRDNLLDVILRDLDLSRPYVIQYAVLLDQNRLLAEIDGDHYYLYDSLTGNVYDLSRMSGHQLTGCAVVGENIVCWNDIDDYWQINVNTLEITDVLTDVPYVEFTSGIWQESGCSFTLYRDEAWNLHVFDFLTGEDRILQEPEGWTIEGYRSHPSPDGRKLYVVQSNETGVLQLLVFDCDRMQFLEIKRDNTNEIQESMTQWTSDNALVVISDTCQDFYVYQWKEMENEVTEAMQYPRQDADFVAVRDYIPDIFVDLKYAQPGNFTGQTIYDFQDAYLRYGTVVKLAAVQEELRTMGLGLKIWDGFRPTAAQFKLWEIYPDDTYVANPNVGFSNHSRGNAVDLTLVDSQGRELSMPTEFDDFSGKADRDYSDCSAAAADNAMLLQEIMEKHGFKGYYGEWWHYADSVRYEVEQCFDPALISQWYAACEEYISLRSAPDTAADTITRIPEGEEFTRLGQSGEFFLVEYQGQRGYVLSAYTNPL